MVPLLRRKKTLRVLVACEFSGTVRDAFRIREHDAWSCDLLDTEVPGPHFKMDIRRVLCNGQRWDLMIAFPPCTHLACSGARWFKGKEREQEEAIRFAHLLMEWPGIPRTAVENPIGVLSTKIRRPDQIVHPWEFGHGETKATCLWLRGLPHLQATNVVTGREPRVHREPPSLDRWKRRSRTYTGLAEAMAEQWGGLPLEPAP